MTAGAIIGAVAGGFIGALVAWLLRSSFNQFLDRVVLGAMTKSPDFAEKEAQFRKQFTWAIAAVFIVFFAYSGWRSFG